MEVCFFVGFIITCPLFCCKEPARKVPINYILWLVFTLCWGYAVGSLCSVVDPRTVLVSAVTTLSMFIGLTLLACYTQTEKLTWCWSLGAILSFVLMPMIFFMIFIRDRVLNTFVVALAVVLFAIYIVYDTKLIMKKLSVDDYIVGSIIIYMDVIQIFLCLLSLFGSN